jgi:uncharacterized protein YndB with AHSA1/START domain
VTDAGKSSFVYVTYIRTTPERLWSALTSQEFSQQYWRGAYPVADWKVGGSWKLVLPDGRVCDTGEIVVFEPSRRLGIRWRNEFRPEFKAEGWSLCTMEIEPVGDAVKTDRDPQHRARRLQIYRRRLGRLAAGPVESQIAP